MNKKRYLLLSLSLLVITITYAQQSNISFRVVEGCTNQILRKKIEKNTTELLNNIQNSYNDGAEFIHFTNPTLNQSVKEGLSAIWSSSKFFINTQKITETLLKTPDGFELRNIPISIDSQQEELVFSIDTEGHITDVYFAVNQHQYKNITPSNTVIDETKKNIIRDFLESLKTAYIKKDIDFINMVMSDKALIVVGKKIQKSNYNSFKITDTGKGTLYGDDNTSIYKKVTKKQYITSLKNVFKRNKNILIDFSEIEFIPHRKSGYESFYGVRLIQKWQADSYSDLGLLFFVIEFREDNHPLIWVRVWQDAKTTSDKDRIGMGEILIQPN